MATLADNIPLVVIVGQTASGKSGLAMKIAKRYGGEIIAADSRTIYKGLDIGSAKPSPQDQQEVPHHLVDILEPGQIFSASDFQRLAFRAIADVGSCGKLPLLVGGTGLYIDSVIYNFSFRGERNEQLRQRLEGLTAPELRAVLAQKGIPLPKNDKNPRHLIRALETGGTTGARDNLRPNTLVLGIEIEKDMLKKQIEQRTDSMLAAGLEQEVRALAEKYSWACLSLQSIGYQEFRPYFEGRATLAEVRRTIIRNTMHYARRQKAWFKRDENIHWISSLDEADDLVTTLLNKRTV